jgi:hypothetical protein
MEEHIAQLEQLLQALAGVGFCAHPSKTIVATDCIPFLGHLVTASQLQPEPAKVSGMCALQPPTSVKRLQAHLGLFNYYRCYIPAFSRIAQPLYSLLRKGAAFIWGEEQQAAYDQLKAALSKPGTALRQPDPALPFRLYTDWSCNGIAAVLNQLQPDGSETMVACSSRSLSPAEKNYAAWKGEMLAAVYGIRAFRPYLLSRQFELVTDHRALLWLLTHKAPVGQQARWVLSISEFQFSLVHRAGTENPADLFSREPRACAADWTGSRLDTAAEEVRLPAVYRADGSLDPTVYSHHQLAAKVCISSSSKVGRSAQLSTSDAASRSSAAAPAVRPTSSQHTAAGAQAAATSVADSFQRPSACLAQLADQVPVLYSQVEHSTLQALAAISSASSSFEAYDLPPASLLGGYRAFFAAFGRATR